MGGSLLHKLQNSCFSLVQLRPANQYAQSYVWTDGGHRAARDSPCKIILDQKQTDHNVTNRSKRHKPNDRSLWNLSSMESFEIFGIFIGVQENQTSRSWNGGALRTIARRQRSSAEDLRLRRRRWSVLRPPEHPPDVEYRRSSRRTWSAAGRGAPAGRGVPLNLPFLVKPSAQPHLRRRMFVESSAYPCGCTPQGGPGQWHERVHEQQQTAHAAARLTEGLHSFYSGSSRWHTPCSTYPRTAIARISPRKNQPHAYANNPSPCREQICFETSPSS